MSLNAGHPLVLGLNHALSSAIPTLGQRTVSLPLRLDGTGSVAMGVVDMASQASVKALELVVNNVLQTRWCRVWTGSNQPPVLTSHRSVSPMR